ncbi:MAG: hypothetical protein M3R63_16415 [Actinomycetota bacterium]|nr:hypothetical protein [Actinomycetota bacterium]
MIGRAAHHEPKLILRREGGPLARLPAAPELSGWEKHTIEILAAVLIRARQTGSNA